MKKLIIILTILFLAPVLCSGATYYVDDSALDDNGIGSVSSPKKYIESGISLLSSYGGDTLVINDGTYSTSNDQITNIPNGVSGAYNVIKAANDGGVIITAATPLSMVNTDQYIQIEGLKFVSNTAKTVLGDHIKILRCGFEGGPATNNTFTVNCGSNDFNDTEYILFEDCWSYGSGGRYNFMAYNSNYVIFRRCVARHDGGWTDTKGDPEAGICIYNSSYVEIQNCIVIDSDLTYHTWVAAYYIICNTASNNGTVDIRVRGSISLNNPGTWGFANDGDCDAQMTVFEDNVAYGSVYGVGNASSQCDISANFNRCTVGSGTNGFANWNANQYTVSNSLLFALTGYDFNSGIGTRSYNNRYGVATMNGCTSCTAYNQATSGLSYLPRIETGSVLKTSGSSGGQMGAEIMRRWGTDGTLWGETGYNILSSVDLWPYPNESRIETDFASYDDRGFCAAGTRLDGVNPVTLTSYVWELLGNEIPEDIYGIPTYDLPTITIQDASTSTSSATISGTYTKDDALTAVCTWSHSDATVTGFATLLLGVISGTVTGLPVGTTSVTFVLTDSANQEDVAIAAFERSQPAVSGVASTAVSHGVVRY